MNEPDSNGEFHPTVPPPFTDGMFLVLVENNETGVVCTSQLKLFTTESAAQDYAGAFTQHWITTRIVLLPVNE